MTTYDSPTGPSPLAIWRPYGLAALRIMTGLLFLAHGSGKFLGFPALSQVPPSWSLAWWGGLLELAGGLLITLGLFTRPVAFILAGEMAVAYFIAHAPRSFFPVNNGGDAAILYCFVFLYLVFAGAGALSVDRRIGNA
jgi:putative oxidoreductase